MQQFNRRIAFLPNNSFVVVSDCLCWILSFCLFFLIDLFAWMPSQFLSKKNRKKCFYWHKFVSVAEESEPTDQTRDGLTPDLSRSKSRAFKHLRGYFKQSVATKVQIKGGFSTVQMNSWCTFITQQITGVLFSDTVPHTAHHRGICDIWLIKNNWQKWQLMHD